MKKGNRPFLFATTTIVFLIAAVSPAAVITLGGTANPWDTLGVLDNLSTSNTATIVSDGVTFSLGIMTTDDLNLASSGVVLGIFGINNANIDNLGEQADFSLTVSGAPLQSLSLQALVLSRFSANNSDVANLTDGGIPIPVPSILSSGATSLDYGNELLGLTPLTLSNVRGAGDGSWELGVGFNAGNGFVVQRVILDYELAPAIPEPGTLASLAALLLTGGFWAVRRRVLQRHTEGSS